MSVAHPNNSKTLFARYFRHEQIYDWLYHEMRAELRLNDEKVRGRRNRGRHLHRETQRFPPLLSQFALNRLNSFLDTVEARHGDSVFMFNLSSVIFFYHLSSLAGSIVRYSTRTYSCELASLFLQDAAVHSHADYTDTSMSRFKTSFEGSQ